MYYKIYVVLLQGTAHFFRKTDGLPDNCNNRYLECCICQPLVNLMKIRDNISLSKIFHFIMI